MEKWKCAVCGYIYDPTDNGLEAGTKFEDAPEDMVCPICGVGKENFEKE